MPQTTPLLNLRHRPPALEFQTLVAFCVQIFGFRETTSHGSGIPEVFPLPVQTHTPHSALCSWRLICMHCTHGIPLPSGFSLGSDSGEPSHEMEEGLSIYFPPSAFLGHSELATSLHQRHYLRQVALSTQCSLSSVPSGLVEAAALGCF